MNFIVNKNYTMEKINEKIEHDGYDGQQYLFFDLGHDQIKIANYTKNINRPIEYFKIPT